ncbi:RNA polymerase recycling motor HelD [Clostridium grantii]|uniref:DNA helicase-2 / ATP-dependent DNA helicase PcrA n=1 Tax=Clostridium grantii DSM 8605 TaxID=1121316 RepID=A0A1M5XS42_9CLOT|nr:RNA polymerase recycling motor HelD [Clostridium grantii]SHI02093.1 DNA helicase-2 / ATP-dependent DNA helicase PcrA [Clostridium grantii DSM 8605]
MAIKNEEFRYEKDKLVETENWIDKEAEFLEKEKEYIDKKLMDLVKKNSTYSVELESTKKVKEINDKSLMKFKEASETPYFARIDFCEKDRSEDNFYIGKFGLFDNSNMEEKVIDWRAPVADLYYSGTSGNASYEAPIGEIKGSLNLKRKFLIKEGELLDAFDEGINEIILKSGIDTSGNELVDEFLKINLEEAVSSKLKDVVATIQKEQNDIIRADLNQPIIVQGSAGSGKTTVALHRLAYLLYRHNKTISGSDILVVAPNKIFLDYISQVLPNLGSEDVKQVTFYDFAREFFIVKNKFISREDRLSSILEEKYKDKNELNLLINSSKFKGMAQMKVILDRLLKILEMIDIDIEDVRADEYMIFPKKEIMRLYARDLVYLPINKRKLEIKRYLNGRLKGRLPFIWEQIDLDYIDRINLIKSSEEKPEDIRENIIKAYNERDKKKKELNKKALYEIKVFIDNWITKDIVNFYHEMYIDKNIFIKTTGGKIPEFLREHLSECHKEYKENKLIDDDDLAPLMYLKLKIDGADEKYKYKHIVIDEVQDYSVFQLIVLNEISKTESMTLVGDLGQGIYFYKGISEWEDVIKTVFNNNANYITLTQSYRSTVEIIEFANKVLEKQKNNLIPAKPVLRHGDKPKVINIEDNNEFKIKMNDIVKDVQAKGRNNIAIICKTLKECEEVYKILKTEKEINWVLVKDTNKEINLDKIIIPSYMTKGLEFDCSVIYNCSEDSYKDNDRDKKLLYVVLTRALHLEYVFYKGQISPLIEKE